MCEELDAPPSLDEILPTATLHCYEGAGGGDALSEISGGQQEEEQKLIMLDLFVEKHASNHIHITLKTP